MLSNYSLSEVAHESHIVELFLDESEADITKGLNFSYLYDLLTFVSSVRKAQIDRTHDPCNTRTAKFIIVVVLTFV